jgi:hypothetical protein
MRDIMCICLFMALSGVGCFFIKLAFNLIDKIQ